MRADKQVFIFFILICQFLIIWTGYMLSQIISKFIGGISSPWPQRMINIFLIILSISSMIMMYGISVSIKKALATQIRQENIEKASHLSGIIDSDL
jgi:small neutral amino acid transporter SnatA (MarC family)